VVCNEMTVVISGVNPLNDLEVASSTWMRAQTRSRARALTRTHTHTRDGYHKCIFPCKMRKTWRSVLSGGVMVT
jgi:hypothetical protein